MRDIKPNKKDSEEFDLPPLDGDGYKELELYEANLSKSNKTRSNPKVAKPDTRKKDTPRNETNIVGGSKVGVTNVAIEKKEIPKHPKEKIEKRPMFAKAPLKKPGKIKVGKGERKVMMALLGLLIIAAIIASVIFLPTASIELKLRTAPLLVDDKILIGPIEKDGSTVPGTSFFREISVSGTQKVISTEVVGSKSKGEVEIVNKTLTEQKIKEKSRLETKEGLLFYMDKHAIVPPNSRVTVTVEADQEGTEGNIEPQRLDFVALDDASKTIVFAQASKSFSGGSGETIAVVSAEDIESAKEEALKNAIKQAQGQIQNELPEGWVLLEESWDQTVDEFVTDQKEGDKIPIIDYKSRATVKVIGYEKDVFENKMQTKLGEKISEDYMLFPGPISYTQSVEEVNWEEAEAKVAIRVTHSTIPKIALDSLKDKLAGRSSDEVREYLEGLPGVRSASMKLWPFWVKSIPRIEKRIEINLESEKKI